jgi:hypothetical protein
MVKTEDFEKPIFSQIINFPDDISQPALFWRMLHWTFVIA